MRRAARISSSSVITRLPSAPPGGPAPRRGLDPPGRINGPAERSFSKNEDCMVEAVLETDAALDAQVLVYGVRFLAISHYRALRAAKCAQRTTVTERWVN